MKTPSSALKVLTVSVFTILIVCFVCYRVGAFDNFSVSDKHKNIYSNYESSNTMAVDTPVVKKDSVIIDQQPIDIMPSSKSIIMPSSKSITLPATLPNGQPLIYDSVIKHLTPKDTTKKKPLKKSSTMSSSKSGIIYEPEPQEDTAKKPK